MADEYVMRILTNRIPHAVEALIAAAQAKAREAAQAIVDDAKAAAPVRTGFLRDSIHVEAESRIAGGVHVRAVVDAPYAGYVEYGTRYMAAHPFWTPAVERHWDTYQEAWRDLESLLVGTR